MLFNKTFCKFLTTGLAPVVVARGNPTEFRGAQYRPLYREAEGLANAENKKRQNPTEFRFAGYARLYKEANAAGLSDAQE